MNEPATLTTPWGNFILAPGLGRASLRVGRRVFERPGGAHPSSGNMVATTADANAARNWVEDGATSQDHAAALLKNRLYRRWGIKTAREYARIKIDGLRLVGGNPDFTNPPGHGDDDARFYDRQQAYVHARGG